MMPTKHVSYNLRFSCYNMRVYHEKVLSRVVHLLPAHTLYRPLLLEYEAIYVRHYKIVYTGAFH